VEGSGTLRIEKAFSVDQARQAQEASQSGSVTGKLVVRVD